MTRTSEVPGIRLTLKIWRQAGPQAPGRIETYRMDQVSTDMSFLEMLDELNEQLVVAGEDPVAFDHDCREGICGACSLVIDGQAHGPEMLTTVCQLHMRHYSDGDTIYIEPWRANAFPVLQDLVVDTHFSITDEDHASFTEQLRIRDFEAKCRDAGFFDDEANEACGTAVTCKALDDIRCCRAG